MSQATLANLLDVGEQTIHRWETNKSRPPKSAEALIRLLYEEHIQSESGKVRAALKRIADLENELDLQEELVFKRSMDRRAHVRPGPTENGSGEEWALAAA